MIQDAFEGSPIYQQWKNGRCAMVLIPVLPSVQEYQQLTTDEILPLMATDSKGLRFYTLFIQSSDVLCNKST